ncbi:MAG: hypothetical protein PHX09_02385 [Clostridia bacterium]|nr:hypothetical protein [Clostridia bacterium]MDD4686353.1 hypothetical protein [Clostridia bacterium]
MDIKVEDVITLNDNNKYVIVSKVVFEKNTYLYIVDINNNSKFKIVELNKDKLLDIKEKKLVQKLITLFYESAIKTFDLNALAKSIKK